MQQKMNLIVINCTYSILEKRDRDLKKECVRSLNNKWAMHINETLPSEKLVNIGEWFSNEREGLKRYFLIYGYGRWQMIRDAAKNQGYNIEEKSDEEMNLYANAFIATLND